MWTSHQGDDSIALTPLKIITIKLLKPEVHKFWLTFCTFTVDTWPDAEHGVHDQKPERHERYEVVELVGPVHGHAQQHHQEVEAKQYLNKQ